MDHARLCALVALAGCGRLHFDELSDAGVPLTTVAQTHYIKASNTDAGDGFSVVALSADGNTLAVGAPTEASNATGIDGDGSNNAAAGAGAVYVFARIGTTWQQQAYIKASNADAGDNFGELVALSDDGSLLAVAAPFEASAGTGVGATQTDNSAASAGAVYVFARAGTSWAQQEYIKASNASAGDRFGTGLGLSGDGTTLVVGAFLEQSSAVGVNGTQTDNSMADAGAAYVYQRAGTTWTFDSYLKASNTGANDNFGRDVAISGDGVTVAVGARGEASGIVGDQADNSTASAGAVYVFTHALGWSQQAYIKAPSPAVNDVFGRFVRLSNDGSTLSIDGYGESSAATGVGGDETNRGLNDSGAGWVFVRTGTTWSESAYLKEVHPDISDETGYLAMSNDGRVIALGPDLEDSAAIGVDGDATDNSAMDSGAVYLYQQVAGAWTVLAYVKASNTDALDGFGQCALSRDGTTLAVGAYGEASAATGIDGDSTNNAASGAGAVYVFELGR